MSLRAVVGFGANLGDRLGTMRAALRELGAVARVEGTSRVYATAPVGPPQPEYLNAAALVTWEGTAEELLDALLAIEAKLGRVRGERFGPRTIDLDVLWIEGVGGGEPEARGAAPAAGASGRSRWRRCSRWRRARGIRDGGGVRGAAGRRTRTDDVL